MLRSVNVCVEYQLEQDVRWRRAFTPRLLNRFCPARRFLPPHPTLSPSFCVFRLVCMFGRASRRRAFIPTVTVTYTDRGAATAAVTVTLVVGSMAVVASAPAVWCFRWQSLSTPLLATPHLPLRALCAVHSNPKMYQK